MILIETNIDDASPEWLGSDFQNGLLEHGAVDFFFTALQMKKGRPGLKLSLLTTPSNLELLSNYVLENTSSIGVRYYPVERSILERRHFEIDTHYGKVQVKEVTTPSGAKRYKIEYESLQKLKKLHNISIFQLEQELYPLLSNYPDHEKE